MSQDDNQNLETSQGEGEVYACVRIRQLIERKQTPSPHSKKQDDDDEEERAHLTKMEICVHNIIFNRKTNSKYNSFAFIPVFPAQSYHGDGVGTPLKIFHYSTDKYRFILIMVCFYFFSFCFLFVSIQQLGFRLKLYLELGKLINQLNQK